MVGKRRKRSLGCSGYVSGYRLKDGSKYVAHAVASAPLTAISRPKHTYINCATPLWTDMIHRRTAAHCSTHRSTVWSGAVGTISDLLIAWVLCVKLRCQSAGPPAHVCKTGQWTIFDNVAHRLLSPTVACSVGDLAPTVHVGSTPATSCTVRYSQFRVVHSCLSRNAEAMKNKRRLSHEVVVNICYWPLTHISDAVCRRLAE